jgi:hypothetical protein
MFMGKHMLRINLLILFSLLFVIVLYAHANEAPRDKGEKIPGGAAEKQKIQALKANMKKIQDCSKVKKQESAATLQGFLTDKNSIIRAQSAHGLGMLAGKGLKLKTETITALESALEDKSSDVIIQAASSLKICSSKKSEAKLVKALKANIKREDGYDAAVRTALIQALGACTDPKNTKTVKLLIQELEKHEGLSYDNTIVTALAQIGSSDALQPVNKHLERLLANKPKEKIALSPWQEAVKVARGAIKKLEKIKEADNEE